MRWDAHPSDVEIAPSTVLTLMQWPRFLGLLPQRLRVGDELVIQWPTKPIEKVRLSHFSKTEAIFDRRDKTRWRMTPWRAGDPPINYDPQGRRHETWVVRGKV